MVRSARTRLVAAIALVSVIAMFGAAVASASNSGDEGRNLNPVRAATTPFHNLDIAMAAGYGPVKGCAQNPGVGAMGQHYVKGDLVGDPHLDELRPEALVYEPRKGGGYQLVAVEYIVLKDAWHAAFGKNPPKPLRQAALARHGPERLRAAGLLRDPPVAVEEEPVGALQGLEPARVLPRPALLADRNLTRRRSFAGERRRSSSAGDGLQDAVLAVVADLQAVVEQVEHVDVADEEGELDELRVGELLVQLLRQRFRDGIRIAAIAARVYSIARRSRGTSDLVWSMTISGSATMSAMSTRSQCEFVQNWHSLVLDAVMITSSLTRRSSSPPG